MRDDRFLDTNILIYAFSSGDGRSRKAECLLEEGGRIGVQVLNEFANVARRRLGWSWLQIERTLDVVIDLTGPVRPVSLEMHRAAAKLARTSNLSIYDALIVAAAADAGCQQLLTEDLQHGQKLLGVTITNPFLQ